MLTLDVNIAQSRRHLLNIYFTVANNIFAHFCHPANSLPVPQLPFISLLYFCDGVLGLKRMIIFLIIMPGGHPYPLHIHVHVRFYFIDGESMNY